MLMVAIAVAIWLKSFGATSISLQQLFRPSQCWVQTQHLKESSAAEVVKNDLASVDC